MDTPEGLIVPNVKNCEQRNLWDIAAELERLHEAGRRGAISPNDLREGTFTLSNIGAVSFYGQILTDIVDNETSNYATLYLYFLDWWYVCETGNYATADCYWCSRQNTGR